MIRSSAYALASVFMVLYMVGSVPAITCEECLKIDKERNTIRRSLLERKKEIEEAFEANEYAKVRSIRKQINDSRKRLIRLDKKSKGCSEACKPGEVKRSECRKIKLRIGKLESGTGSAQGDSSTIDRLYRDLLRCNRELRQVR